MARVRRQIEVLDRDAAERATKASKHALLMCALGFGGTRRSEVLFAVARSYTAAERVLQSDESHRADIVWLRNAQFAWMQLETAEDALCAAAEALPQLGRRAVGRLIKAARAYSEAWEFNRARRYALCAGGRSATFGGARGENPSRTPAPMQL